MYVHIYGSSARLGSIRRSCRKHKFSICAGGNESSLKRSLAHTATTQREAGFGLKVGGG